MGYGDIPDSPAWGIEYRLPVFQSCPFCRDEGCNYCRPKVRDGKSERELFDEAHECCKAYSNLIGYPDHWSTLPDVARKLIVFAIDYGRNHKSDNGEPDADFCDRFKELELR